MATSMFGGASEQEMLDKLLGGGPELEDFVSSSPQDLPSFDHAKRYEQPMLPNIYHSDENSLTMLLQE